MSRLDDLTREARISLLAGGLVALLILIAGAVLALGQKTTYTAESVVVVLPRTDLDDSTAASYYDTLSRGQIVGTFAEVAGALRFEQQAEARLSLTDAERATATTTVSVVPATSVLSVRAFSDDAEVAERLAEETMTSATEYLRSLSEAYRVDVVSTAEDSAFSSSTSPKLMFALSVAVAPIAGLAIQQAIYHLLTALRPWPGRHSAASGTPASTTSTAEDHVDPADDHERVGGWR